MDLPPAQRAPAGGGHRRGRAAAVHLPRAVAAAAGQVQARPGAHVAAPAARGAPRRWPRHLQLEGMPMERALGTAFRLLDLGFFRIGGEAYAEAEQLLRSGHHPARSTCPSRAAPWCSTTSPSRARSATSRWPTTWSARPSATCCGAASGGPELLAYRDGQVWRDVTSADINAYIKEQVGGDVSAKDFRTWHGTVIAAVALAEANEPRRTESARKRAVSAAMREVSDYLGNTPAVARKSYVDPRVIDLFHDGVTISADAGPHGRRPVRRHHPRQDRTRRAEPAPELGWASSPRRKLPTDCGSREPCNCRQF